MGGHGLDFLADGGTDTAINMVVNDTMVATTNVETPTLIKSPTPAVDGARERRSWRLPPATLALTGIDEGGTRWLLAHRDLLLWLHKGGRYRSKADIADGLYTARCPALASAISHAIRRS
jgi:hypothetical protein